MIGGAEDKMRDKLILNRFARFAGGKGGHVVVISTASSLGHEATELAGDQDRVAPPKDVQGLVDKLKTQKGITITQKTMVGANHFFQGQQDELITECSDYLDMRLAGGDGPGRVKRLR